MNSNELKQIAVLKSVPDDALERLAAVMEERRFSAAQTICSEGDPGDSMFFILEGSVSVEKKTSSTGTATKHEKKGDTKNVAFRSATPIRIRRRRR